MRRVVLIAATVLAVVTTVTACGSGDSDRPSERPLAASPSAGSPAPGTPVSMAALGDSISRGFSACGRLGECTRASWTTGDDSNVNSHYRRILGKSQAISGKAYNFAKSGATMSDLPRQATEAARLKASYVTVLIGGNDACRASVGAMTPVGQFRASLDTALATLRTGAPEARVLVVSIPDVYRLWEVGHTNTNAKGTWGFGICQALLANPDSTDAADEARRQEVRTRVQAYNEQLDAACRAYGSNCRYDGGATFGVRFTAEDLSTADYFHPSAAGQRKLAEVTYAAGFGW